MIQDLLNDPEMKAIALISGYVRELREGKDYESTTFQLVDRLKKLFSPLQSDSVENLQIFEYHFKKGMINKDFEAFKRTHPTLLRVILAAMDEIKKSAIDNHDFGEGMYGDDDDDGDL